MSGNIWMFSHMIDDEDLKILQKDFITYYEGADYYGLGLKVFTRMSHEAGAVYKIGKMVRIRRDIFEEYLRCLQKKEGLQDGEEEA
ncbi:MAG: DNA-binding protein [Clostridia bacterium]|nr:DNA-binding protein [Clostridia bacterium]